jgi:hypothetical protein
MAHTPAPWKFTGFVATSNFGGNIAAVQGDGTVLARVKGGVTEDREIAAANARLIAAAPDLLAALQALSALNDNYAPFGGEIYQDRIERAWDNARAAIARATHPANPLRGED